jgi:hypothetical protein
MTLSKFQVSLKHMAQLWRIKRVKIMFNNHMGWLQKYKNMEFLSNKKSSRAWGKFKKWFKAHEPFHFKSLFCEPNLENGFWFWLVYKQWILDNHCQFNLTIIFKSVLGNVKIKGNTPFNNYVTRKKRTN